MVTLITVLMGHLMDRKLTKREIVKKLSEAKLKSLALKKYCNN